MVECQLPKLDVGGSSPLSRSILQNGSMFTSVYILYSKELDRYYVGMTTHTYLRYKQHLRGQSVWTSRATDWVCVYRERVGTMEDARMLEKRIKACGAHRYLERQKSFPIPPLAGQG